MGPRIGPILCILFCVYFLDMNRIRLILREFITTETEEKAMAAEAIIGVKKPKAANGIAITL